MEIDTTRPIDADGPVTVRILLGFFSYPSDREKFAAQPDLGSRGRATLRKLTGERERLAYPTRTAVKGDGKSIEVYEIPSDRLIDELGSLHALILKPGRQRESAFDILPDPDTVLFDAHEGRWFRLGDAMVIREDGSNFAVSPYYLHSGGTAIAWACPEQVEPVTDEDDEEEDDEDYEDDED